MNRIQFQQVLSLPQSIELHCTEEKCEPSLEKARWPDGFRCPRCHAKEHGLIHGRRHKRYQCRCCRHQATLAAETIMEATKIIYYHLITRFLSRVSSNCVKAESPAPA